ncbi:4Fe-4S cluster-binding domain-containing protein [Leptolyngbya sp. 7M]|uniref:4Fe-4S cluster-binding domain-containing protein n=1 Tax=Leptolyngbya sp. 7M TaxID=2812896 RepID=UPI001B8C16D7|nr:4Fe-4S cluster-binding domain-containing protein [Leptolyngbya sp. 7M]QYO65376.1 4Fe-4S cluster-binding domain-containing protein [Leptolyngbya sp. 7M]
MNKELVFVLEPDVGRVTVEVSKPSKQTIDELSADLGTRVNLNCSRPAEKERYFPVVQSRTTEFNRAESDPFSIWLYRLYHNSVVDGPGRRSVIQTAGCSIRCVGCFVPQTHERENGTLVSITSIVDEVLSKRIHHDGVTILGGEPFDQPGPIAELVSRLKRHQMHITVYSGFTIEQLIQRKVPSVDYILVNIDLLIEGPFINNMREGAGEYRGSRNQQLIGR